MSVEDSLAELASQLGSVEEAIADLTLEALRSQIGGNEEAKELERRLSRARRSVAKAKGLLEGR